MQARAAQVAAAASSAAVALAAGANNIDYAGGPVIHAPVVFYIWYGGWAGNSAPAILTDFANSIGGSPYFGINGSYADAGGRVRNSVTFGGSTSVGYSHGTQLDGGWIKKVVIEALTAGALPVNPDGVYFVMTSADVSVTDKSPTDGFCVDFCGWHTRTTFNGTDIKFSFVGNGDRCPSACQVQNAVPNGNAGADGMASVVAHELEEAATDPDINAWFTQTPNGVEENADKCAWQFGQEYSVPIPPVLAPPFLAAPPPGAASAIIIPPSPFGTTRANMRLGARDYLIQTNWLNADGGLCSLGVRRLQVDVTGAAITVDSQPAGISCGGAGCVHFFNPGVTVTLTASVPSDTAFKEWVGCDSVFGQTCQVALTRDRGVIARAAPICSPSCYQDCFADCRSEGKLARACVAQCKALCGC